MSDMPLFRAATAIETQYSPDAEIVLGVGDVNSFIQQIPDQSVTLVITSLPYNLGKEYEDRVSIEHYLHEQSKLIAQLHRVLADDGNLCWQVGNFVTLSRMAKCIRWMCSIIRSSKSWA